MWHRSRPFSPRSARLPVTAFRPVILLQAGCFILSTHTALKRHGRNITGNTGCSPHMKLVLVITFWIFPVGAFSGLFVRLWNSLFFMKDGPALLKRLCGKQDIFPNRGTFYCWLNGDSGERSGAKWMWGFRPAQWIFPQQPDISMKSVFPWTELCLRYENIP